MNSYIFGTDKYIKQWVRLILLCKFWWNINLIDIKVPHFILSATQKLFQAGRGKQFENGSFSHLRNFANFKKCKSCSFLIKTVL